MRQSPLTQLPPTYSTRSPSALGQGVSFKDVAAGARTPTGALKSGSSVTFGSINDVAAPISSSPAAVPTIKSEGVKSFGSVPATPTSTPANGKLSTSSAAPSSLSSSSQQSTAPSTPSKPNIDIKKLFQGSSGPAPSTSSSQSASDFTSPSNRPSLLHPPPQAAPSQVAPHQSQPSQLGAHSYTPFVPGGGFRAQQNGGQPGPGGVPHSPVYSRQVLNGQVNGANVSGRPNGMPGGPGSAPAVMPAGMSSPRMGPPHGGQPAGMAHAPPPVPGWPGYYYPQYPGMPPEHYMSYATAWHVPQHAVPPQHQHHPSQGPPGPPHTGMPISPRNPPPPLHTPGTPTLTPAIPSTGHPPHATPSPRSHTASLSSVSSPPPTPSVSTPGGAGRLNTNASTFIPRKPVKITTVTGTEVNLEALKKQGTAVPSPTVPSSPARKTIVRMETEEAKNKRLEKKRLKEAEKTKREATSTELSREERFPVASCSTSMSSTCGTPMESSRIRSQRGKTCSDANRANAGISDEGSSSAPISTSQQGAPLESVALLEVSANRWQLNSLGKKPQQVDTGAPEVVDRKVRALLNTLTMERFDSISDQIIAWANKSEKEKGRRTLIQVIRLVFEKATDEATWSEMYARLCRKMTEQISSKVQDDGIKSAEGKPIAGGQLFRKYLLNRCQKDFKRGWVAKEVTAAAAAATKVSEDQAVKAAAEKNNTAEESVFLDEYYAAQKAKRQGLGLIKFIGELFKLQMLTERIMHECVKKLLGNVENPEEEEIESLCKLLTTVGRLLDTQKARAHMDVYFSRMRGLAKNPNVNSCVHVMLQDVIELRERNWVPYDAVATSTTIAAVHEAAAKEKAAHEKAAHQRTLSMSRGGFKRGGERGDHSQVGPNGWAVAGSAPRPPPKAGDLSNFGKISKTTSMIFGPTSVFTSKDKSKSRESTITRAGSQNMFSKLMENPELASEAATSKSSRPPSRKPSVDLGGTGLPEATPQRRKLNLLPRSKPLQTEEGKADSTPAASEANSDDEDSHVPSMSEEEAKTRIDEDLKEFFSIRDLDEAEIYFSKLPSEHKWRLVDKLVMSALESKEADAQLVADFFSRAASNNLCSPDSFEAGFMPAAETLDDVAIDAPKAFNLMATMMKGARLDEERRVRLARKWMVRPPLSSLRPPQELGTPPFYSKGTIQAASPFNRNDADMILRSSDEVDFRTHRVIISFTSDSLFTTPGFVNTPMDDQDGLAVFTLSEDAQTLDQLLRICYPTVDPVLDKTEDIEAVLVAAVKYQIEVAQVFYAKALMNPKILQCDPFSVYAITCRFLLKEQTHAAAKVTLYHHLPVRTTSHSFPNALKDLPATSLLDLIQYRDECKNAALSVLSDEGYWQLHADKFDHSYKYCEDCHFLMHDSLIRRFDLDLQQYRAFVHNALISTPCGRMKLDGDDILASRIWRIHGDIVGCISCHKSMILKLKGIDSAVNAEVERRIADVELHLGF